MPTYLDTWITLISAVGTLTGANPKYQLRAEELQRIQSPVLLVWGDNDPFGSLDLAREAARILPNARLHEMRAGHLLFLDKPRECGDVIRKSLSRDRTC